MPISWTKRSGRAALVALALLGASALAAIALALDGAPLVAARSDVAPADVERALAIARLNDPRSAPLGQSLAVTLLERDVDLGLDHAVQRWLGGRARVQLRPGRLLATATFQAPAGRWLNVHVALRQTPAGLPAIDSLRLGHLPLPAGLALPLARAVAARHGLQADALLAVDWVERVRLNSGQLAVTYRIGPDTLDRLRAALVAPAEERRLHAYNDRLVALTQGVAGRVPLSRLLSPLLALAAERSAAGGDAVAENRAALVTLALYANRRPIGLLVPSAYGWPRPQQLILTLQGRDDFALHFLVSAVVAAQAGTPLADAVGVWKELADARAGGSGFSFNDIAADRAGTRFGEAAVAAAERLQARCGGMVDETAFMPDASDLPEFLPEADFRARYGGVGSPAYNRVLADIDARVEALSLFQ